MRFSAFIMAAILVACGDPSDPDPAPVVVEYGYPSNWCCVIPDIGSCRLFGDHVTVRAVDDVLFCVDGDTEHECHPEESTCYWSPMNLPEMT